MSDDCEDRLLEIQYFLARDWSLDPHLVMACDTDAKMLCGSNGKWWERKPDESGPPPGHLILSCLYRHAVEEDVAGAAAQAVHGPPGINVPKTKNTVSLLAAICVYFQLTQRCASQVHRVMRERAGSVALQPDIEENCRSILAEKCSRDTRGGAELNCLMELMDKEEIKDDKSGDSLCFNALMQLQKAQSVDYRMNKALERACRPVSIVGNFDTKI